MKWREWNNRMHCMNMIKLISTYALKRYFVMSVPILPSSAASN